jgi:hypothetical protein
MASANAPVSGYSPRGMDIDRNGVVWAAMASGHMARFDRRQCKGPLNGPKATGQQCPEGWTFYAEPLPQLKGVTDSGSAEASYYTWVDQTSRESGAGRPQRQGLKAASLDGRRARGSLKLGCDRSMSLLYS